MTFLLILFLLFFCGVFVFKFCFVRFVVVDFLFSLSHSLSLSLSLLVCDVELFKKIKLLLFLGFPPDIFYPFWLFVRFCSHHQFTHTYHIYFAAKYFGNENYREKNLFSFVFCLQNMCNSYNRFLLCVYLPSSMIVLYEFMFHVVFFWALSLSLGIRIYHYVHE